MYALLYLFAAAGVVGLVSILVGVLSNSKAADHLEMKEHFQLNRARCVATAVQQRCVEAKFDARFGSPFRPLDRRPYGGKPGLDCPGYPRLYHVESHCKRPAAVAVLDDASLARTTDCALFLGSPPALMGCSPRHGRGWVAERCFERADGARRVLWFNTRRRSLAKTARLSDNGLLQAGIISRSSCHSLPTNAWMAWGRVIVRAAEVSKSDKLPAPFNVAQGSVALAGSAAQCCRRAPKRKVRCANALYVPRLVGRNGPSDDRLSIKSTRTCNHRIEGRQLRMRTERTRQADNLLHMDRWIAVSRVSDSPVCPRLLCALPVGAVGCIGVCVSGHVEGVCTARPVRFLGRHGPLRAGGCVAS